MGRKANGGFGLELFIYVRRRLWIISVGCNVVIVNELTISNVEEQNEREKENETNIAGAKERKGMFIVLFTSHLDSCGGEKTQKSFRRSRV